MRIKLSTLQKIIKESLDNAYDVLGIQPGASPKEIRAAWRQLVLQLRADKLSGAGHGFEGPMISHANAAVRQLLQNPEDPMFQGYEGPSVKPQRAPKERLAKEPEEAIPDLGLGRAAQGSYKVYPWQGGRSVIRVSGQLYGTGEQGDIGGGQTTRFKKNDRAEVEFSPENDGRPTVKKPGEDYSQVWNSVDEVRKIVDDLVIEMVVRMS